MIDGYKLALIGKMRQQGRTGASIAAALRIKPCAAYKAARLFPRAKKEKKLGGNPRWPLKKASLSREQMAAMLRDGKNLSEVARIAGVSREAIRRQFPLAAKEAVQKRHEIKDSAHRLSAAFFRREYRAALKAAGWARCAGNCREWVPLDKMTKSTKRCRFCNNEWSRAYHARKFCLEFIPNNPAIWWRQRETGESRPKLRRRRKAKAIAV